MKKKNEEQKSVFALNMEKKEDETRNKTNVVADLASVKDPVQVDDMAVLLPSVFIDKPVMSDVKQVETYDLPVDEKPVTKRRGLEIIASEIKKKKEEIEKLKDEMVDVVTNG